MPATNWNQDQPIVTYLKHWLPLYFPVIPKNHPPGHGVGGYKLRTTASGGFSAHSEGRAADIYLNAFDSKQRSLGDALFDMFITSSGRLGVDHTIWNHNIWSSQKGGPRTYFGKKPHTDHVHVAFTRNGSQSRPPLLLTLLDQVHMQVYGTGPMSNI